MKSIKKIAVIGLTIIGLFNLLALNNFALAEYSAQSAANDLCSGTEPCLVTSPEGIYNIIEGIAKWIYTIFFAVAVIFILFAAFTFLTAGGDPTKINSGSGYCFNFL